MSKRNWLKRKQTKGSSARRLGIEQLDARVMLDAGGLTDFGAIDGQVAVDLNDNGTIQTNELIAGAEIKIVLDDGDGIYDPNTDTVVTTVTTDADGYYRADGLATGTYFAIQCAGTADGFDLEEMVSAAKSVDGSAVVGTSVDSFGQNFGPVEDFLPGGTPEEQNFASSTALGSEVDLLAEAVSGSGSDSATTETDNGTFEFSSDFNATGEWRITWDGADAAGNGVNPTGLGGVDLTDIGGTSGLATSFLVSGIQVDPTGVNNTDVTVRIFTDGGNISETTFTVTDTAPTDHWLDFSTFTSVAGGGADFTNVGAVELIIQASVDGVDGQLVSAGAVGAIPVTCDFLNPQPEPTANLVTVKTLTSGDSTPDEGDTVTFEIVVTNNGDAQATNVSLVDQLPAGLTLIGGSATQGNYSPATAAWTIGTLNDGETATLILDATVDAGQGGNTITNTTTAATGDQDDPSTAGDDLEEEITVSRVAVPTADLVTVKTLVSGDSTPNEGDTVTFEITITNNGPDDANNVQLFDLLPSGLTPTSNNGNGGLLGTYDPATGSWTISTLDSGETATLILEGTVDAGQGGNTITNTTTAATADEDDPSTAGDDLEEEVTVNGPANFAVDIEKFINGNQADNPGDPDVPILTVGDTATKTYVVTNQGNRPLDDVVVTDSVAGVITNLVSGDTDGDGRLDVNETWIYESTFTVTEGPDDCTATVTTDEGVSDADDSNYIGIATAVPAVDIEKFINGQQADNAGDGDVPAVDVGDTITKTYVVTNPGDVSLTNVTVVDSDAGVITNLVSGDDDGDGELDTDETWVFEATVTASAGSNECTATVTTDEGVSDSDDGNYVGIAPDAPAIDIEKFVNGQQADDAGDPDVPSVMVGDTITKTYVVTNMGNVPLTNVTVTDSVEGVVTNLVSGDDDGDGELDTTETWIFEVITTAVAGDQNCTATVTTDEGVSDADDSNYVGIPPAPAVDIEKFVNGQQADNPGDADVPTVLTGDTITKTYVVTNPGNVPLTNVVVTDDVAGVITNLVSGDTDGDGQLDTDETWVFEATVSAALGSNDCEATVTTDEGVSDSDTANFVGADAAINVVKQVLGTPVGLASNINHFAVTYEATIRNTGPVTLTGLDLFDDVATQFNGAFVSVSSPPVITDDTLSSAANLPSINAGWANDVTQSIFNDDGSIAPGETITLQFVIVIDGLVAGGDPVNNQIEVTANDPVNGGQFGPSDLSDDGVDNGGNNPGFPGDTGGANDPSPVVLPFTPLGLICGNVYIDTNNDGIFNALDGGESPIEGVEIMLSGNGVSQSVFTAADGSYCFTDLLEGDYQLMEVQPEGFLDGQETLGDFGRAIPENDKFDVALFFGNGPDPAGLEAFEYNFGELGVDPREDGKEPFLISNVTGAGGIQAAFASTQSETEATIPTLDGDVLVIMGTGGIDEVTITAGQDIHVVNVNGLIREFSAEQYHKIHFDGSTGDDRVTIIGSDANDRAVLKPFEASVTSDAYEISVENARYISAEGGGGTDEAFLVDGAGDDVFLGASAYASMRDVANAYKNELREFEKLTGNAVMGGNDTAVIYDSAGDDAFLSVPGYSQMIGGEYEVRANKFESIEARANAGGRDSIELRDSIGDDVFTTDGHRSTFEFGTGFHTTATGFEDTDVLSRWGDDTATVSDWNPENTLNARGQFAYLNDHSDSDDDEDGELASGNVDLVFEAMGS